MNETQFKGTIQVEKIRHYKNNWGIIIASVSSVKKGSNPPILDRNGLLILKGVMAKPILGEEYYVVADFVDDPKWGQQYDIKSMGSVITFDVNDSFGQKQYLLSLFKESMVKALYDGLDSPFEVLDKGEIEKLVQIKGIGIKKGIWMVNKFRDNYGIAKIMLELDGYGLTTNMMKKLLDWYHSADLVIEKVKENPYTLSEMQGIGWAKADEIAQAGGMGQYCTERVTAFITYYLNEQAQNGFNYISTDLLMDAIVERIGEDVSDFTVSEAIHGLGKKLWYDKDKTVIGLAKYHELELNIAKELIRLRNAPNDFKVEHWENIVKAIEYKQGWNYTEQQYEGIKTVLSNNVVVVTGLAGTGKSTVADAMLQVLHSYSHCLAALSGKAASRLAEITGEDGKTIHRLLGYPDKEGKGKNGFAYTDEHQLPYDIIVIDEVSMIGGSLFYYLLRAIKSGSKLVLLGDIGQLESIGECKVAVDIIDSVEIPTVTLDKIHRQAQASAIITESIHIRKGEQIISKDWAGEQVRGQLQDLLLDCYSDKSNTFYKVMEHFQREISTVQNILDVQILCPVKNLGDSCTWSINNAIQELYNPKTSSKHEVEVFYRGKVGILREGDKVINRKNNYKTFDTDGFDCPIFNGNIGILREVDVDGGYYVVDFQGVGSVVLTREQLNSIELGYAITVHSSQGSQWSNVIVAIDYSSYALLSRELIYTAITRAKKHCTLVAQNSALRFATAQEKVTEKTSHLVPLLSEVAHPKLIF